jgi:hypothetical protein
MKVLQSLPSNYPSLSVSCQLSSSLPDTCLEHPILGCTQSNELTAGQIIAAQQKVRSPNKNLDNDGKWFSGEITTGPASQEWIQLKFLE